MFINTCLQAYEDRKKKMALHHSWYCASASPKQPTSEMLVSVNYSVLRVFVSALVRACVLWVFKISHTHTRPHIDTHDITRSTVPKRIPRHASTLGTALWALTDPVAHAANPRRTHFGVRVSFKLLITWVFTVRPSCVTVQNLT